MKKKLLLLLLVPVVLGVVRWQMVEPEPVAEVVTAFDGKWISDCFNDGDGKGSYRTLYRFEKGEYALNILNYAKPGCQNPTVVVSERGVFLANASQVDNKLFQVDMKRTREVWMAADPGLIGEYSDREECGISDWMGEVDVTGKVCQGQPIRPVGTRRFDLVKVEMGKIYFGDLVSERDGSAPERRPTQVFLDTPYQKFERRALKEFKVQNLGQG